MFNATRALALAVALFAATSVQAQVYFYEGALTQAQETGVPATPNPFGGGVGFFSYDAVTGDFLWDIFFQNLTGPVGGAHLHIAPPGADGPIVIDLLAPGGGDIGLSDPLVVIDAEGFEDAISPLSGFLFGDAIVDPAAMIGPDTVHDILTGAPIGAPIDFYVNIHTAANPAGEIRGQLFVSLVPIPAAAWLFAPAIGLLVMRRRA